MASASMALETKKINRLLLAGFNLVLLVAAWVMVLYTYPKIPATMPARLGFFGLEFGPATKSLFFFLCPLVQSLLTLAVLAAGRFLASRSRRPRLAELREEHLSMAMIFVNSAIIHLEKNLVGLAVLGTSVLNKTYFFGLLAVVPLLYLYYRLRAAQLS
jgi:uncharacterized membrane protein